MTTSRRPVGGIIHTYQRYDPQNFPSPTRPPPDVVSGAMEHLLAYGSLREMTEEELARAVTLDPSQIAGLGPSLEALLEMLRERKRKILERYETSRVRREAARRFHELAGQVRPPPKLERAFRQAVAQEQLYDLERLWYRTGDERSPLARQLVQLVDRLGDKYQVDELAGKYAFTGRTPLTIPQALAIKQELEEIDRLLAQLEEAAKTARIGLIDLEALAEYAPAGDVEKLSELGRLVEQYLHDLAERQGLERSKRGYRLTPKAYRLFQQRLLERIFGDLQASRTGRHAGPVVGEGAIEMQQTKPYEFGDSLANMDLCGSLVNALVRAGPGLPVPLQARDILVHRTRNTPKCATAVLLDMSGSMRYDGLYINVKRLGLALDGLVRREYPGDWPALHRGLHLRQAPRARPVAHADAQARYDLRFRSAAAGRHGRPADQRTADPAALHQHPARLAVGPATAGRPGHAQPADHLDYGRTAHGAFRGPGLYLLYPPDCADRGGHDPRGPAVPPRGHRHQYLPAAKRVAIERGRAVRPPAFRMHRRPGVLHRRQGPGPLRAVGLPPPPPGNHCLSEGIGGLGIRDWSRVLGGTRRRWFVFQLVRFPLIP